MDDKTYKKIEIIGTSAKSQDDAIRNAVEKAGQTLKNLRWYEVVESRGNIQDGVVNQFQVCIKVVFKLD